MKRKFIPKPGQVDYTNIRWAPVINCVLKNRNKILLVQRSKDLEYYPGYWTGISGFLDTNDSLSDIVYTEIEEELGFNREDVTKITAGDIFEQEEPKYKKTWIVHPV
jgi:ADP-ribose pyrophosphatase YjhB (NUDIX family)